MSLENIVPEIVFIDGLDSSNRFLMESGVSSNQNEYNSKENISNSNCQLKCSSDGLPFNMAVKEPLNDDSYCKDHRSMHIVEQNFGENSQSYAYDESVNYNGHSNFKLEWDSENRALYVVIPSVDSLDHWMMLFLQPLGITCDSLNIDNCCLKRNCDFRIRLDDERLLLYPDLLKDISDFISKQYVNWQYYKERVILRGSDMICSENDENLNNIIVDNQVDNICCNYSRLPDINVSVNIQRGNDTKCLENENSCKYYGGKNYSQNNNELDKSSHNSVAKYSGEVYERCILVPELCPKGEDSLVQSNALSCLTTNISDSNVLTTDSGILQVLTSENSNHEENYFTLNSSNSAGANEKEYFPIETWSINE
ncbi:hypothetical protein OJ252_2441 [Cryptosporidium canis]|uniref:Uncharacterized protein n=1 Tax=Cryptosporidium canis TaxID=195482 RepID=A0ABQ8P573_9CRYT|nr:hypothetical protein OJ252_2441 [Cryptosporidium canis]